MRLDLALVGFGHVGRRFARLLQEQSHRLAQAHDLTWRIVGIATRRHGTAIDFTGLDLDDALEPAEEGRALDALHDPAAGRTSADSLDFLAQVMTAAGARSEAGLVVVETTVLDVERGQPAIDHVRAALTGGAHVITTNKGPVAFAYRELQALADERGVSFLFEGTVLDGIPVFNLVRETLPAVEVTGFRGVVNTTTTYILTAMEDGRAFGEALAAMQAAGIAESDASLDIDGWDAAAKTAALANVLMQGDLTPHQVERTGIAHLSPAEVGAARRAGRRIRLVASAERRAGGIAARVAPTELPGTDVLASLTGLANALVIRTDLLGDLVIAARDSGLTHTAYALLSDLVRIRRRSPEAGAAPVRRSP